MIVEIKKKVEATDWFEVRISPINKKFSISLGSYGSYEGQPKTIYVTREELELISKAIIEELKKADG